MRRSAIALGVACGLWTMVAVTIAAHHSISAAYDDSKRIAIEGVVEQFQFINPHPFLIVTVMDGGTSRPWRLEMDNRSELARVGVTAMTFVKGDRVVVNGSPSRSAPAGLYIRRLERPSDGFVYEQVGQSPRVTTRPRE